MALAKNLASGTLAESISASTTTLLVYVGEGSASTIKGVWPNTPFYASIMPATPSAGVPNSLDSEIVKVTAVSNDQVGNTALTVIRAQRGTTGKAFTEGAIVTNADYADDAVLLSEEGTSETETPWVGTDTIEDNAITNEKLDWTTLKGNFPMATKELSSIGWNTTATLQRIANIVFIVSGTQIRNFQAARARAALAESIPYGYRPATSGGIKGATQDFGAVNPQVSWEVSHDGAMYLSCSGGGNCRINIFGCWPTTDDWPTS